MVLALFSTWTDIIQLTTPQVVLGVMFLLWIFGSSWLKNLRANLREEVGSKETLLKDCRDHNQELIRREQRLLEQIKDLEDELKKTENELFESRQQFVKSFTEVTERYKKIKGINIYE